MKLAAALLFLGVLAAPAVAQESPVATLTKERCQLCHMEEEDSAPSIGTVKKLEPADIVEKLTNGTMSPMAAGLSQQQKREIAVFLTGKPLAAEGELPEVKPGK